jgi:hypothetical protein
MSVISRRSVAACFVIFVIVAAGLVRPQAAPPELEPVYYNDELYLATSPGGHSSNPNQLTFGCFSLGPDLNDGEPVESIPLYAVLWPGGEHACPDGTFTHDHVATAVPGTPGFRPHWRLIFAIPVSEDVVLPLTSAAAVEEAVAAGQVLLVDTGVIVNAPLVRRAG